MPRYPCQVCGGTRKETLTITKGHTACRECYDAYQEALPQARSRGWSPALLLGWEPGLLLVNRLRCQRGDFDALLDARVREPSPLLNEQGVPA